MPLLGALLFRPRGGTRTAHLFAPGTVDKSCYKKKSSLRNSSPRRLRTVQTDNAIDRELQCNRKRVTGMYGYIAGGRGMFRSPDAPRLVYRRQQIDSQNGRRDY